MFREYDRKTHLRTWHRVLEVNTIRSPYFRPNDQCTICFFVKDDAGMSLGTFPITFTIDININIICFKVSEQFILQSKYDGPRCTQAHTAHSSSSTQLGAIIPTPAKLIGSCY